MSVFNSMSNEAINNIRRAAAEAQAKPVAFLRFDVGIWTMGGNDVTDSIWLALPDLVMIGWKRFEDRQVMEEIMKPISEDPSPARPKTFTNRDDWPLGNNGRPMDPWSKQLVLPLLNQKAGKIVVWTASSVAARMAIGVLLDDFASNRRRQVVTLSSEKVRDGNYDVHQPKLVIVEHSEHDAPVEIPLVKQTTPEPEKKVTAVKPNGNGGGDVMDDGIPF
jgi:hypothetical protein